MTGSSMAAEVEHYISSGAASKLCCQGALDQPAVTPPKTIASALTCSLFYILLPSFPAPLPW